MFIELTLKYTLLQNSLRAYRYCRQNFPMGLKLFLSFSVLDQVTILNKLYLFLIIEQSDPIGVKFRVKNRPFDAVVHVFLLFCYRCSRLSF
jgi:hypothetical protein